MGPSQNYVLDPSGNVVENTNVSLSDISSNTELETCKFNAFNQKINHNQMKGMQFYQQQLDKGSKS